MDRFSLLLSFLVLGACAGGGGSDTAGDDTRGLDLGAPHFVFTLNGVPQVYTEAWNATDAGSVLNIGAMDRASGADRDSLTFLIAKHTGEQGCDEVTPGYTEVRNNSDVTMWGKPNGGDGGIECPDTSSSSDAKDRAFVGPTLPVDPTGLSLSTGGVEMTRQVNLHEAKTHLSRLVDQAANGDEIVIARGGRPVARLVALAEPLARRQLGLCDGQPFSMADDFDQLPEDVARAFEGE